MKKILSNIAAGVIGIYCLFVAIMATYYNWQYAKENGFIKWLFLGEVVSTFKSFFWPYFVLH